MSRKGKLPIPIPKGVEAKISGNEVIVKGPKGTLSRKIHPAIDVRIENDQIHLHLKDGHDGDKNFHGLYRSIINNMVLGSAHEFEKKLEMIGVGYRAAVQGHHLDLQLGFSHPTKLEIPQGVHVKVEKNTLIIISGIDKQKIGQFAADVRGMRPPEPYQGKGIRYSDEHVRRKAGKSASAKK